MMNHRQVNTGLWWLSGVLACAAIAAIVWAVASPLGVEARATSSPGADLTADTAGSAWRVALPPLETFSVVWRKPVRAPLFVEASPAPASAPPPKPAAPSAPPLQLKLLATAVEAGHSYAVLLDDRNMIEVKRVGESAAGATLTRIESDRVEFEHHGRNVTLTTPEVYGQAGDASRRGRP